jgi:hypothetical protein
MDFFFKILKDFIFLIIKSGYSFYLARNIPFSYIQYNIYVLMTSIFLNKNEQAAAAPNNKNSNPADKIQ